MKEIYNSYNGTLTPSTQPLFSALNRSFRFGDSCFESMVVFKGQCINLPLHVERIRKATAALKMQLPAHFDLDFVQQQVQELLLRNEFENARVRLTFFRNDGGVYQPETNTASFVIEAFAHDRSGFELNAEGLNIDVFEEERKNEHSVLSNYKTGNSLSFVLASLYKQEKGFDECIILNTKGQIAEFISCNFFLVKDDIIYTPPLSEGCIGGVMRSNIINLCRGKNLPLREETLTLDKAMEANEVFVSNAVYGVQWVKQFRNKSYTNETSSKLMALLQNEL